MIAIKDFCTQGNNIWQELIGVSSVGGNFILQNMSRVEEITIAVSSESPADVSGNSIKPNAVYTLQNNGEKVWVRSGQPALISISRLEYENKPYNVAIAQYALDGHRPLDKFGTIRAVTTAIAPIEVYEGGQIFGRYNYISAGSSDTLYISSSDSGDTNRLFTVSGLAAPGEEQTIKVTTDGTDGQTAVQIPGTWYRVWRAEHDSDEGNDLAGTVYVHTNPTPVNGVPVGSQFRIQVSADSNQSLMALFTIPLGKVGFLHRGELGVALEGNAGALAENARIQYQSRRVGKLFKVKKEVGLMIGGSSLYKDPRTFPDIIPALTDIRILVTSVTALMDITSAFDIELVDQEMLPAQLLSDIQQPIVMPTP